MIHYVFSSTLFTKMNYSLIEIQLRRFIYLGHKHSIYVNPIHRTTFWKNEKDLYELNGIKIIANIIAKNKTKDINSIVPIILKVCGLSWLLSKIIRLVLNYYCLILDRTRKETRKL